MWIAGWGATTFVAEAEKLQEAKVPVLPISKCKGHFAGDITSDKICTFDTDVEAGPCDGMLATLLLYYKIPKLYNSF
jgi:hypothetical protein